MTPVAATCRAPPPLAGNVSRLRPNSPSSISGPSASAARDRWRPPRREQVPPRLKAGTWLPKSPAAPDPLRPSRSLASARRASRRKGDAVSDAVEGGGSSRRALQIILWAAEAVYILWLFLLPYAPGDPVWAISSETVNSLVGLSLNFFFILPLMNSVGINLINAPVLHPMSEGLFNFVIGWTFMFAPLLFTDLRKDRYKGSLDILWGLQMFLTNTFLIPYMAIRLNEAEQDETPGKLSQLGSVMTNGAPVVGLIGGGVCLISVLWALFGRSDGDFGGIADRLDFLVSYLGSERLAYAFIWDIVLYTVFQPWLIGDNLRNIEDSKTGIVNYLRFIPVVGLIAYLLCFDRDKNYA
ncbi:hypothetical protein EUGRSUZ_G02336 [Eucalyptus grandis]|uniref:Uncharacterized protein n=2 Tax=Eucalyptus grandis TaxID=71139 RepID=A0A059BFC6_EUCGR|nr:hypothetical protein EUGRSUZ_G02336 [Eucalyptus grandis]